MTIAHAARSLRIAPLVGCLAFAAAGCGSDAEETPDAALTADAALPASVRGIRYCEVLIAVLQGGALEAQVWGTQGLNDCPEAAWASIDPMAIRDEFGAAAVVLNGPRHWVLDRFSGELPAGSPRLFAELEMQKLATLTLAPGATSSRPFVERTVKRNAEFEFRTGAEVYELLAPNGSAYVMQSYAQTVDPSLSEGDLAGLGARLMLPAGWTYRARTLESPLVVSTPGEATVVQDDLQNTYSRHIAGE